MPHMQQSHPAHRARMPRAHRDAAPHPPHHAARTTKVVADKTEWASAQTIFYIARGAAILLAAVAVGLSTTSDDAERTSAAYPPSPHATTR